MKPLRTILAAIAVISVLAGYLLRNERPADERAALSSVAPGVRFLEKAGSPPHYTSGTDLAAFNSYDVTATVRGYAGPIKVMIALGRDGIIKGIEILEHRETKNYVHYMENFSYLGRYIGKSVHDRFEIDRDIDGISRATVSVDALARTVRDSSRIVAQEVFGISVKTGRPATGARPGWILYAILFAGAAAGYYATRRSPRMHRARDLCMVASIGIVGFGLSSPFSVLHVYNLAMFRPSGSVLWFIMVASTFLSVAFAGRFYCGWLCPFGAILEFLGRLPLEKWNISGALDKRWRKMKYYLLGVSILIVFLTGRPEYGNFETYVTLFSFHGSILAWTLVALSLIANLKVRRFWCRVLCPVAALTGLLARRANGYSGSQDCPMANRVRPEMSECIRCNRCFQPGVGPDDEKPLHKNDTKLDNGTV